MGKFFRFLGEARVVGLAAGIALLRLGKWRLKLEMEGFHGVFV